MGKRVYSQQFHAQSLAAVQDLFSIKAAAGNGIELLYCQVSATGQTSASELDIQIKRVSGATVTQGTGGASATAVPNDDGDTKASTATVHTNDTTTQATGTTVQTLDSEYWNVLGKYEHLPTPELTFKCQGGEMLVASLATAPGSAITCSGRISWAETP